MHLIYVCRTPVWLHGIGCDGTYSQWYNRDNFITPEGANYQALLHTVMGFCGTGCATGLVGGWYIYKGAKSTLTCRRRRALWCVRICICCTRLLYRNTAEDLLEDGVTQAVSHGGEGAGGRPARAVPVVVAPCKTL